MLVPWVAFRFLDVRNEEPVCAKRSEEEVLLLSSISLSLHFSPPFVLLLSSAALLSPSLLCSFPLLFSSASPLLFLFCFSSLFSHTPNSRWFALSIAAAWVAVASSRAADSRCILVSSACVSWSCCCVWESCWRNDDSSIDEAEGDAEESADWWTERSFLKTVLELFYF